MKTVTDAFDQQRAQQGRALVGVRVRAARARHESMRNTEGVVLRYIAKRQVCEVRADNGVRFDFYPESLDLA
jgi:hypothetical protein